MTQGQRGHALELIQADLALAIQTGGGTSGADQGQLTAQAIGPHGLTDARRLLDQAVGNLDGREALWAAASRAVTAASSAA